MGTGNEAELSGRGGAGEDSGFSAAALSAAAFAAAALSAAAFAFAFAAAEVGALLTLLGAEGDSADATESTEAKLIAIGITKLPGFFM